MKRKILPFIFSFLLAATGYSQKILSIQEIKLETLFFNKTESYPIIDNKNGGMALFLLNYNKINANLFDKDYKIAATFTLKKNVDFKNLIGSNQKEGKYNLFFTDSYQGKIYSTTIDIQNRLTASITHPIKLGKEKFLEGLSYKNKFYVLTVTKKTSLLKIYVFEGTEIVQINELDFSSFKFSNNADNKLYHALKDSEKSFIGALKIRKIDNTVPNPLEFTTHENKLYCYDNKIFITLDHENDATRIITINLKDFSQEINTYKHWFVNCGEILKVKSNSFLYKDILYQVKGCKNELYFAIYNLSTHTLVKDFRINKNEEIYFKNSPLIQEGNIVTDRELNKTKQILRKIKHSDMGVAVYQLKDGLEVTIGGYKESEMLAGFSSGGISVYVTYKNTRATYFKSLFDSNTFEHIEGVIKGNAFDKIKSLSKSLGTGIAAETVIKEGNSYIFGYYLKYKKQYYLSRFSD